MRGCTLCTPQRFRGTRVYVALEVRRKHLVADEEPRPVREPVEFDGLARVVPVDGTGDRPLGGVGVAIGLPADGGGISVRKGACELLGGEVQQGFIAADAGEVLLHDREVEREGYVHQAAAVGEAELRAQ